VDYKVFNKLSGVDCMVQVNEAKNLGIAGEVKPETIKL
jgi:hypothetical protein